ncbi:MAG: STAS domain-containing protein [bacterium]
MPVKIEFEHRDSFIIVWLEGRIGGEASITMYKEIKSLLVEEKGKNLIIDFGKVDFIDSSGLGSLVAVNSHLIKNEKKLILTAVPENMMGLLKITNLTKILKIVPTVEEAFEKFNS